MSIELPKIETITTDNNENRKEKTEKGPDQKRIEKKLDIEKDEQYELRYANRKELTKKYKNREQLLSAEELQKEIENIINIRIEKVFGYLPEETQKAERKKLEKEYNEKYSSIIAENVGADEDRKKLYDRLINQIVFYRNWQEVGDEADGETEEREFIRGAMMHSILSETELKQVEVDEQNINVEKGPLYAVYKTENEDLEKLTPEHAKKYVDMLFNLQDKVDREKLVETFREKFGNEDIIWVLEDYFDSWDGYKENTEKILSSWKNKEIIKDKEEAEKTDRECGKYDNYINPAEEELAEIEEWMEKNYPDYYKGEHQELKQRTGEEKEEYGLIPFWMLMEYRGLNEFKAKGIKLIEENKEILARYQKEEFFIVNGDSSPDNSFDNMHPKDWERVGVTNNRLNALIYDYGSMRAEAWDDEEFKKILDYEIMKRFKEVGDIEAGKAVIRLAILRSYSDLAANLEKEGVEPEQRNMVEDELKRSLDDDYVNGVEAELLKG